MKNYPQELKDRLTARLLAPHNESITALARETQIPKDTLYGWRVAALGRVPSRSVAEPATRTDLTSDDKFTRVVATAGLNEHELSEYCRTRGLYVQQVQAWRERCRTANAGVPSRTGPDPAREQAREIRCPRGELQRKDQAQDGTPILALQELGGWQSEAMVRRYAHFSMEHLRRYVERPTTEEGGAQNVYRPKLRIVKGGLSA